MSAATKPSALAPGLQLYQMAIGHYVSRALELAARLGIADQLAGGPRSAAELAALTACNAAALRRVLRLLVSVGVFRETEQGELALTELSELLRKDVPGSARASVLLFAGRRIQDGWKELEYCVRTGQPAFRKLSPQVDPFSAMDEETTKNFDAAMATFAPGTSAAMAAAYDFSQFGSVMDVGGGNGAILIGLLRANPGLRGIVFDRPATVQRAVERVAEAGLAERCQTVAGDFFASVPSGADAYLLKHVIHDWDDEKATAILRNVRGAMSPSGRVLIAEGVYPAHVEASLECRGAASNDVNMLVSTGGRQRSEEEFRALYRAAGFELTKIVPTAARLALIEGIPR